MKAAPKLTRRDWLVPAGLILLSLIPALAGSMRVASLVGGGEVTEENARFFAMPVPVLLHIPAAIIYSILGALQFSPGFRKRNRPWHRVAGKVLIPAAIIVAASGLWMAHFYAWPVFDGQAVYVERLIVGVAMLASIGIGVDAIRRRDFQSHGHWMIRAYALGMGAATQVLTHLPWFIFVGGPFEEGPRAVMMGGAWALNVLVAEWVIRRDPKRASQPRAIPVAA